MVINLGEYLLRIQCRRRLMDRTMQPMFRVRSTGLGGSRLPPQFPRLAAPSGSVNIVENDFTKVRNAR